MRNRGVEYRTNVGELGLGRRRGNGESLGLTFRLDPGGVDVGVRLDRRIEIAVDRFGAFRLAREIGALGAQTVDLAACIAELAAERLRLTVNVSQLTANGVGLRVCIGQVGPVLFGLRFRLGKIRQQDVRLRLHFGE